MLDSTDESSGLKKEAQHKSMENIFYYGPESVSISPFTNGIQSGMHRVEQNKGFGLVLDDIKDLEEIILKPFEHDLIKQDIPSELKLE